MVEKLFTTELGRNEFLRQIVICNLAQSLDIAECAASKTGNLVGRFFSFYANGADD